MIIALLQDPFLRATVRRAALPDEDVFWKTPEVEEALARGFPRLAVYATEDPYTHGDPRRIVPRELPLLAITHATVRAWESQRHADGFALSRIDDHGRRLRSLMEAAAGSIPWVDSVFRDLVQAAGAGLPAALKGFGRRILESPARYEDLHDMAELTGLSRGALKARFRRRDLLSPYAYLRWFRVIAAAHVLSDGPATTEEAAHRTGLHSSGNFCRYVQEVSGIAPSRLREPTGRIQLLTTFVSQALSREKLEAWKGLEDLFLEEVA